MFWYIFGTVIVICHIPITVDIIRLVRPQLKIPRVSGSISRLVLVFLTGLTFCVVIYQYFTVFVPLVAPDPLHSLYSAFHVGFAVWLWINVVGHFYTALFVHPGEDRESELPSVLSDTQRSGNGATGTDLTYRSRGTQVSVNTANHSETSELELPVCDALWSDNVQITKLQCGMEWRPRRSNYCRVCRINVAYADHHCPYLGKCLGVNNYAHFYIGLIYGLLGMLYTLYVSLPYFYMCDIKPMLGLLTSVDEEKRPNVCEWLGTKSRVPISTLVVTWICSTMVLIQTAFLLSDISTVIVLKNFQRVPVLRFMWHRFMGRIYLQPHSRFNVLIRKQRPNILYYILPLRSKKIQVRQPVSLL